jgi:hypothetical protein
MFVLRAKTISHAENAWLPVRTTVRTTYSHPAGVARAPFSRCPKVVSFARYRESRVGLRHIASERREFRDAPKVVALSRVREIRVGLRHANRPSPLDNQIASHP